jgi:hypothetical protein
MKVMAFGTQPFSLEDAAAYPYAAGVPGAITDLFGVRSVTQTASVEEVENRGDGKVLATAASFNSMDVTITLGAFNPASVAAISGGTVTTAGVPPASIIKLERKSTDTVPYFKLVAQTYAKDDAGGAGRLTFPKVAWTGGPDMGLTDNEFMEVTVNAKAIPDSTSVLYQYEAYETWTALV